MKNLSLFYFILLIAFQQNIVAMTLEDAFEESQDELKDSWCIFFRTAASEAARRVLFSQFFKDALKKDRDFEFNGNNLTDRCVSLAIVGEEDLLIWLFDRYPEYLHSFAKPLSSVQHPESIFFGAYPIHVAASFGRLKVIKYLEKKWAGNFLEILSSGRKCKDVLFASLSPEGLDVFSYLAPKYKKLIYPEFFLRSIHPDLDNRFLELCCTLKPELIHYNFKTIREIGKSNGLVQYALSADRFDAIDYLLTTYPMLYTKDFVLNLNEYYSLENKHVADKEIPALCKKHQVILKTQIALQLLHIYFVDRANFSLMTARKNGGYISPPYVICGPNGEELIGKSERVIEAFLALLAAQENTKDLYCNEAEVFINETFNLKSKNSRVQGLLDERKDYLTQAQKIFMERKASKAEEQAPKKKKPRKRKRKSKAHRSALNSAVETKEPITAPTTTTSHVVDNNLRTNASDSSINLAEKPKSKPRFRIPKTLKIFERRQKRDARYEKSHSCLAPVDADDTSASHFSLSVSESEHSCYEDSASMSMADTDDVAIDMNDNYKALYHVLKRSNIKNIGDIKFKNSSAIKTTLRIMGACGIAEGSIGGNKINVNKVGSDDIVFKVHEHSRSEYKKWYHNPKIVRNFIRFVVQCEPIIKNYLLYKLEDNSLAGLLASEAEDAL